MLMRIRVHARLLLATLGLLLATASLSARQAATSKPIVENYIQMMVTAPPAELGLDAFYKKYADAYGIPIVSSEKVDDAAVLMARDIVNYMVAKRPDIRAVMIERKSRLIILAKTEMQTDPPEYRDWKKPALDDRRLTPRERENYDKPGGIGSMTDKEYWNRRARGMGGNITSGAEENLLGIPGTRYYGEHITVHEFSHNVMSAMRTADPALFQEIQDCTTAAKEKGLYKGHYAENTAGRVFRGGHAVVVLVELRVVRRSDTPADARRSESVRSAALRDPRQGLPGPSHSGRHLLQPEHSARTAAVIARHPELIRWFRPETPERQRTSSRRPSSQSRLSRAPLRY